MSTTPRTDAAWAASFSPERANFSVRDECEKLETELAHLRAEVERLKKQIKDDNRSYGCELRDPNGTIWEQAAKDHARAERAEAEVQAFQNNNLYHRGHSAGYAEAKDDGEAIVERASMACGFGVGNTRVALTAAGIPCKRKACK